MVEKAIWLDIALLFCFFICLQHLAMLPSHSSIYKKNPQSRLTSVGLTHACPKYIPYIYTYFLFNKYMVVHGKLPVKMCAFSKAGWHEKYTCIE